MDSLKFILPPVLIGVIGSVGSSSRWYRTIFLEEIGREYVRTARAKGLSELHVLFRHILKNAMIPILTGVVVVIPLLFMKPADGIILWHSRSGQLYHRCNQRSGFWCGSCRLSSWVRFVHCRSGSHGYFLYDCRPAGEIAMNAYPACRGKVGGRIGFLRGADRSCAFSASPFSA